MTVHQFNRRLSPLALAVTLACSAYPALAQAASPSTAAATPTAQSRALDQDLLRLSDEGRTAMGAVRDARMALFNGQPQVASEALTVAKASLQVAKVDEPIDVVDVSASQKGKLVANDVFAARMNLVPIDGRFMVDETLIKTPEQKAHVAKAGEHMAKGNTKDAANELKLAGIDTSFSRVLMPLQSTRAHVAQAAKLIREKKYYDANLALKAAEDGLEVDTVVVSEAAPASPVAKRQ